MERIYVFDTTLRDGEQSPGASMSVDQKVELALQLERLKVDVIEAGFPISSPIQFEGCTRIAGAVKNSTIAVLARALEKDIDSAHEAVKGAAHSRIHTFISTSPIHMEHKLKKKPADVLEMTRKVVRYARNVCAEVEFSPEDASRSDIDFLKQVIDAAIQEGATIINIPDTVGYSTPREIHDLVRHIRNEVPNIDKTTISIHCHDDLGLAVANTIQALEAGARQCEVTINGIGERAGNAALEEVVMALNVRNDRYQLETAIDTRQLYPTSRMLSTIIGFPIVRNKAIVGENAFSHEAGIHQHGMLANRATYEIMSPETVGRTESKMVLGRHSGIHGFTNRIDALGLILTKEALQSAYASFLELADRKKEIFDEDIRAIVSEQLSAHEGSFSLHSFSVVSSSSDTPSAQIEIAKTGKTVKGSGVGDGPIDAVFRAIDDALQCTYRLEEYTVQAISPDKQAMGGVSVTICVQDARYRGHATSTDIIEASAKAYINAINASIAAE